MRQVQASITLPMPPGEVLDVFTRQEHLKAWWNVSTSQIDLKRGGIFCLVWQTRNDCVDYVTTGIVKEYLPECQLVVENMTYINPQRGIFGPMELSVFVTPEDDNTTSLTVVQSGYKKGPDWDWYYEAVKRAWPQALEMVKDYLSSLLVK